MEKKRILQKVKEFFNGDAPMSNGNKYEVHKELQVQKQLDLATLKEQTDILASNQHLLSNMGAAIRDVGKDLIENKNIQPYFLLHMQADYFCNTCKFKTDNINLKRMIINVIRGAFFQGTAGIYKNQRLNILEPVYITNMSYGIDGELQSAKIIPLNTVLQKMSETKTLLRDEELKGFREITDCENLATFSWGTMGYSAWITKWNFVQLQHLMLSIIINNGYTFNKKWIYRVNNGTNIKEEIELFFNPLNPFIINIGNTEDLANRFLTEDVASTKGNTDVIDYYNKLIGVYYHLMGRKINNDYKKERNVSDEVEASQENYDVVQSDWLQQFELFIMQLKEWGLKVEYINEQEQREKEKEEMEEKENEPDKSKND